MDRRLNDESERIRVTKRETHARVCVCILDGKGVSEFFRTAAAAADVSFEYTYKRITKSRRARA